MSSEGYRLYVDIDQLGNNKHSRNRYRTTYSGLNLAIDLTLLGILVLVLGILAQANFPINRLGFFCDDTNIRFPYRDSTIPSYELYIFFIPTILTFIIMTIIEQWSHKYQRNRLQTSPQHKMLTVELNCMCRRIEIPHWVWKFVYILYAFTIGYLATIVVTFTFKVSVGELRPHFHDVCKADFSLFSCKSMSGDYIYVTNYTCTGDPSLVREARLSFPSGHASSITYTMTFLILYLETKLYLPRGIRSMLSLLAALAALLVSLSRLYDFKHHFHDILAGMFIGLLTAVINYFNYLRLNVSVDRQNAYTPILDNEEINKDK